MGCHVESLISDRHITSVAEAETAFWQQDLWKQRLAGNNQPWFYFNRLHLAATAWLVIAEKGINPFWLGSN